MADKLPPEKKDKTIEELLDSNQRKLRSPVLWFFLLLLPVLVSFYSAFNSVSESMTPKKAPEVIRYIPPKGAPVKGLLHPESGFTQDSTISVKERMRIIRGGSLKTVRGDDGKVYSCEYDEWVGQTADAAMQEKMKLWNRPFRIFPPGSRPSRDFNPARINLKTDAEEKILRVWCG